MNDAKTEFEEVTVYLTVDEACCLAEDMAATIQEARAVTKEPDRDQV